MENSLDDAFFNNPQLKGTCGNVGKYVKCNKLLSARYFSTPHLVLVLPMFPRTSLALSTVYFMSSSV